MRKSKFDNQLIADRRLTSLDVIGFSIDPRQSAIVSRFLSGTRLRLLRKKACIRRLDDAFHIEQFRDPALYHYRP